MIIKKILSYVAIDAGEVVDLVGEAPEAMASPVDLPYSVVAFPWEPEGVSCLAQSGNMLVVGSERATKGDKVGTGRVRKYPLVNFGLTEEGEVAQFYSAKRGHQKGILCLAANGADIPVFASGSIDNTVRLWSLKPERPALRPLGMLNPADLLPGGDRPMSVTALSFFPGDPKSLVVGANEVSGRVRIFDVDRREAVFEYLIPGKGVLSLSAFEDSHFFVGTQQGDLMLFDKRVAAPASSYSLGAGVDVSAIACIDSRQVAFSGGAPGLGVFGVWDTRLAGELPFSVRTEGLVSAFSRRDEESTLLCSGGKLRLHHKGGLLERQFPEALTPGLDHIRFLRAQGGSVVFASSLTIATTTWPDVVRFFTAS
jgi:hypothetical protein